MATGNPLTTVTGIEISSAISLAVISKLLELQAQPAAGSEKVNTLLDPESRASSTRRSR